MLKNNQDDKRPQFNIRRTLALTVVAVLVFGLGVSVGNGRIQTGSYFSRQQSANKDLPEDLDYSSVEEVYDSLRSNYDGELSQEELLDGLKEGIARATGDPYTEYLDPAAAKDFEADLNGTFSGIGAELSLEEKVITVVAPIAGFPAEKAGLRPKDAIIEINEEPAFNLSLSEAVSKIRGPVGTKVKLKVIRNSTEEINFDITREQITIPSVTHEVIESNIGYLKVSRFSDDTVELSRQAAQEFKQKGVRGVVLDMRNNPGGLLDASVDLSSLWLERGQTVLQEKRDGVVIKTYNAKGNPVLSRVPTIVLINEGSASASEITAGALKDNGAATIVGEKSYGKGSVQSLINLGDSSLLKVTIARWFTPDGKNIDKEGIEPDHTVARTDEDFTANRDPQKDKAIELLKK